MYKATSLRIHLIITCDSYSSPWLRKNLPKAKQKQSAHEPIRQQVDRLKEVLLDDTLLADVQWDSRWGLSQFAACLRRFHQIYRDHHGTFDLKGLSVGHCV